MSSKSFKYVRLPEVVEPGAGTDHLFNPFAALNGSRPSAGPGKSETASSTIKKYFNKLSEAYQREKLVRKHST